MNRMALMTARSRGKSTSQCLYGAVQSTVSRPHRGLCHRPLQRATPLSRYRRETDLVPKQTILLTLTPSPKGCDLYNSFSGSLNRRFDISNFDFASPQNSPHEITLSSPQYQIQHLSPVERWPPEFMGVSDLSFNSGQSP
jgi:hypothetical protein